MRRRLLIGLLIIIATLAWLAWIDYELILRDPRELNALVTRIVARLLPDWSTRFGPIQVELFSRRLVVEDFVVAEKGSDRVLARVARAEATIAITQLQPREIVLSGVEAHLHRDADGRLNVEPAPGSGGASKPLAGDLRLVLERARVHYDDDKEGLAALLLVDALDVTIHPDGRVIGQGVARAGAILPPTSPFVDGASVRQTDGRFYREIVPRVVFEIDRRADGRLTAPLEVLGVELGPLVRSLLPEYVRTTIWDEVGPQGRVDANVTLRLDKGGAFRPEAVVYPRGVSVLPKGFPYPIHGITGRFEVAPFVISWEDVVAFGTGASRIKSRGSVYVGSDKEKVTLHIFVDAFDIPLDPPVRNAMPPDIRAVYDRFGCEGKTSAKVQIFKGPHEDKPNIVCRAKLDGTVSATFRDVPIKFSNARGDFFLRQGANVQVEADGDLEGGGRAHVKGRVVEGDLIHVEVEGKDVPVGAAAIAALPEEARDRVRPFNPLGGLVDARVVVDKLDPRARAQPTVDVTLHEVRCQPAEFPYKVRASGKVRVAPRWPEGSIEGDGQKPTIDVDLDVTAEGHGLTGARARGKVKIVPGLEGFQGSVEASAARVELDRDLVAALPRDARDVVKRFAPDGALRRAKARLDGVEKIEVSADGDLLTAALRELPYRVNVDRVEIARIASTIEVRRIAGRGVTGGRFRVDGKVELPPQGGGDPVVDVAVRAEEIPVSKELLAALPKEAREAIERLDPRSGRVGGQLKVGLAPGLGLDLQGTLALDGVVASVHGLDPRLAGLEGSPCEDLRGLVRLEGDRLSIEGITGRFRGAALGVSGRVGIGKPRAGAPETPLEIVARVDGLVVDKTMPALLRGEPREALEKWPAEGACDVDLSVRKPERGDASVRVRLHPLRMRCTPKVFPVPVDDLEGVLEVQGGEPSLVALGGRLGRARVAVNRDVRDEAFTPDGTLGIFRLRVLGYERLPELEVDLDPAIRQTFEKLDAKGPIDLAAEVWMPASDRQRGRFLAELRARGTAFTVGGRAGAAPGTAGLRFEDTEGAVRVAGAFGGHKPLSLEGAVELDGISWKKQRLSKLKGSLTLRDGVLSLGTLGSPFEGDIYGSQLRGLIEADVLDGAWYSGRLWLAEGPLAPVVESLKRIREKDANRGPATGGTDPIKGKVLASCTFRGTPERPDGKGGIAGVVQVKATDANLVEVPGAFGRVIDFVRGKLEGSAAYPFARMDLILDLHPKSMDIRFVRLESSTLTIAGSDGTLGYDAKVELDLLPIRTGFSLTDFIVSQIFRISVTGDIADPNITALPLKGTLEMILRRFKEGIEALTEEKNPGR